MIVLPASAATKMYTIDADFNEGELNGVNYDVSDQLQLDENPTTYPSMWIANAGEDTLSKFDTTTGEELARYRTWYQGNTHDAWSGPAPSRTAVDADGNVYVANRHFDGKPASVMKVLVDDWIDRNGNGVLDTSVDSNGDGKIGSTEILPMTDTNHNGVVNPDEIVDERIAWIVQVGNPDGLGRSLAIDPDGNIWLGLYNSRCYYKLDPTDGSVLAGPIDVSPNTPYGALVDKDGILWGASLSTNLLKLDTKTNTTLDVYSGPDSTYGIAIGNDKVYMASQSGNTYVEFDPVSETFSRPASTRFSALGIAVDSAGNIVAGSSSGYCAKFKPDGTLIWNVGANPYNEIRGIVIDSDDNVWAVHRAVNKISKYQGSDGAHLGTYDTGRYPYTYSDATGLGLRASMTPTGTWKAVYDSGSDDTSWGTVSWSENVPTGAGIEIKVRTSNTEEVLATQTYQAVVNGADLLASGRYIQVMATLTASPADQSPILHDLSVTEKEPPVTLEADAGGPYTIVVGNNLNLDGSNSIGNIVLYEWDLDQDGTYDYNSSTSTYLTSFFNTSGDYSVTLRVTDDAGNTDTDIATVEVKVKVKVDVPEFSTVAVPMVAILGLAFVFMRRKD